MGRVVSAGVIVRYGDRFLLLHYEAGHWDFPKGHVEKGESYLQAALREFEEETGITRVDIVEGSRERIHYVYRRSGELVSKDVYFFLASASESDVRLSDEHVGYAWLPFDEALARLTYDSARGLLRKAA